MDLWKFFDITHREHVVWNPINVEKLEELIGLLRLRTGDRVLDIATGKGEFLIQLAEHYGIEGIGVDMSPYCIAGAREKQQQRVPNARLSFVEMNGADYQPKERGSFNLVACIGASWIYGGHSETLKALNEMAAPGSWVVVGEPYWQQEPTSEHLEAIGEKRSNYGTHYENVKIGQELGLKLVYTLVSNQDDWDRYEGLQWYASEQWAREHPNDPDLEEVLKRVGESRENYLKWGRVTFGWSIYVFQK